MKKQSFYYIVSGVFFLIAVFHLARVMNEWKAVMGGVEIPMWVSWAAVIIAGYLCLRAFQYGRDL